MARGRSGVAPRGLGRPAGRARREGGRRTGRYGARPRPARAAARCGPLGRLHAGGARHRARPAADALARWLVRAAGLFSEAGRDREGRERADERADHPRPGRGPGGRGRGRRAGLSRCSEAARGADAGVPPRPGPRGPRPRAVPVPGGRRLAAGPLRRGADGPPGRARECAGPVRASRGGRPSWKRPSDFRRHEARVRADACSRRFLRPAAIGARLQPSLRRPARSG